MKRFLYGFVCALRGLAGCLGRGVNIRVELSAAAYALLLSLPALTSAIQWAVILLCIGLTLAAEVCNTALEALCDKVEPRQCETIRFVKDAAAGAVLVCAAVSAVVGCLLLFGGGGLARIGAYCGTHLWYPALLLLLLPLLLVFICRGRRAE